MEKDNQEIPIKKLHEQLAATLELPVERNASRWLGEAEAVVDDLIGTETDRDVIYRRVSQVLDLLEHVDDTGDKRADEHLSTAKQLAGKIVEQTL